MVYENIILGMALLLVGLISNYAKFGKDIQVQIRWIVCGGFLFLLSGAWGMVTIPEILSRMAPHIVSILSALGLFCIMVGTIWSISKLLKL